MPHRIRKTLSSALILAALAATPCIAADWGKVETPFDAAQAVRMLEPGNATLKGRGFMRLKGLIGGKTYADNRAVYLFPMTGYMQEWYRRFKNDPGIGLDTNIGYGSAEALRIHRQTRTDGGGQFAFDKLKPGKYLLYLGIGYVVSASWQDQVGTETVYNGYGQELSSTPIYGGDVHTGSAPVTHHILKIVDVKQDGQVLDLGDIR